MTVAPSQQAVPTVIAAPLLQARGLSRSFKSGDTSVDVLKQVDLDVRAGEFLAIEGRSGSGKSTLLHLLGALDTPDAGSILFDGKDLARLSSGQRSRIRNLQFGFVFQFYHLLPEFNVLENTLLAAMIERSVFGFRRYSKEYRERARSLLDAFGLSKRLRHKPAQLSGGERQRVAIARALMNKPRVLFADEPTGNLDAETGSQIMRVLEELHRQQGQTIIMVTHDRTIARQADRALVLKQGQLQIPAANGSDTP